MKGLKNLPFDIGKAKSIVSQMKLPVFELKTSNNPESLANGTTLANQWSQAGIKVNHRSFEWGTFYSDVKKGNFQLAIMRWVGISDPDIYRIAFHSKELPPGRNRGSYKNKNIDSWVEKGLRIMDPKKRIPYYYKVQKMILKDLAVIPLWYNQQVAIVSSRVKNYVPPAKGDYSPLFSVSLEAHKK